MNWTDRKLAAAHATIAGYIPNDARCEECGMLAGDHAEDMQCGEKIWDGYRYIVSFDGAPTYFWNEDYPND